MKTIRPDGTIRVDVPGMDSPTGEESGHVAVSVRDGRLFINVALPSNGLSYYEWRELQAAIDAAFAEAMQQLSQR